MRKNEIAFYCEQPTARILTSKLFAEHEICDVKEIEFRLFPSIGIVVPKKSPFRERLLINWIKMLESGIFRNTWRHWNPPKPTCSSSSYFESVRIEYVTMVFLLLIFAYVIAFIIFILEHFIAKLKPQSQHIEIVIDLAREFNYEIINCTNRINDKLFFYLKMSIDRIFRYYWNGMTHFSIFLIDT